MSLLLCLCLKYLWLFGVFSSYKEFEDILSIFWQKHRLGTLLGTVLDLWMTLCRVNFPSILVHAYVVSPIYSKYPSISITIESFPVSTAFTALIKFVQVTVTKKQKWLKDLCVS